MSPAILTIETIQKSYRLVIFNRENKIAHKMSPAIFTIETTDKSHLKFIRFQSLHHYSVTPFAPPHQRVRLLGFLCLVKMVAYSCLSASTLQ